MTAELLLKTAGELTQPSDTSAAEFNEMSQAIAEELSKRMKTRPDIEKLVGTDGIPMMEDNSRNMIRFMSSLFNVYDPKILVDTCCWAFLTYRSHGFQVAYWPANLDTVVEICREKLSPECFEETEPFFNWIIISIPLLTSISDDAMNSTSQSE